MGDSGFGSDLGQDRGESQRVVPVQARKAEGKIAGIWFSAHKTAGAWGVTPAAVFVRKWWIGKATAAVKGDAGEACGGQRCCNPK